MPAIQAEEDALRPRRVPRSRRPRARRPVPPATPSTPSRPLLAARLGADAARARARFIPDLDAIDAETRRRAKLLFVNYPNNPAATVLARGFFERLVEFGAANDILIVHDGQAPLGDDLRRLRRAVVPRDRGARGRRCRGLRLLQGRATTWPGWRCAAIVATRRRMHVLLATEDERRLGTLRGGTTGRSGAGSALDPYIAGTETRSTSAAATSSARRSARSAAQVTPRGDVHYWAPVRRLPIPPPRTARDHLLEEAAVVLSPGGAYQARRRGTLRIR